MNVSIISNTGRLEPYPGAGTIGGIVRWRKRTKNEANLDSYLKAASDRKNPPHEDETLGPEKLREEAIMMGLRLTEGLSCTELRERFGYDILNDKADVIRSLTDNGYLLLENDHLKLAPKALFISDEVIVKLI